MKYETVKSFILFVLVGVSFLLSFILWSYQPNYDSFRNTSYVNEVDIGGNEKTKNELIEPAQIVFHNGENASGFIDPIDRQSFYKDLVSWGLYDYKVTEADGRPEAEAFVELIFPSAVPAELVTSLFTYNDEFELSDWAFERVFITFNDESQSLQLTVLSVDGQNKIVGTVEKSAAYNLVLSYLGDNPLLHDYIAFVPKKDPIYFPENSLSLASKTVVATTVEPELFIDALFTDPSYVTPNLREAYFTDGQRGMRIVQDGRKLEFINPIQSKYDRLDPLELIDTSINNINEHKGWTNQFILENINYTKNNIRYRLYYEGYPVFDRSDLSVIEQEWREEDLYQYNRPLIRIGNLLNSKDIEIPPGEFVLESLLNDNNIQETHIQDIQVGYTLRYLDDAHSITLEPSWYYLYKDEWKKFNPTDYDVQFHMKGRD